MAKPHARRRREVQGDAAGAGPRERERAVRDRARGLRSRRSSSTDRSFRSSWLGEDASLIEPSSRIAVLAPSRAVVSSWIESVQSDVLNHVLKSPVTGS